MYSRINCTRLHQVVPDQIGDEMESHISSVHDHSGNVLYEFSKLNNPFTFIIVSFRDRLRDLLLEGIEVQWGKKCVGYHEYEEI